VRRAWLRAAAADRRRGRLRLGRRLPPPHRSQHLALEGRPAATGTQHRTLPRRDPLPGPPSLADALRRLSDAGILLSGASDHGVSEALYLSDPDGNGIELYRDRPREEWPRSPGGEEIAMVTEPLDLSDLLAELPG
jgi:catechol 2,3-dioxygenase